MKLTKETLEHFAYGGELYHKAIKWEAPSWNHDSVFSGLCIVNYINPDDKNPLHTTPIYGPLLDEAFWCYGSLYYHDNTREVEIELLDE